MNLIIIKKCISLEKKNYLEQLTITKDGEIIKKSKRLMKDVLIVKRTERKVLSLAQQKKRKLVEKKNAELLLKLKPISELATHSESGGEKSFLFKIGKIIIIFFSNLYIFFQLLIICFH